jgi:hypothetical protein
MIDV